MRRGRGGEGRGGKRDRGVRRNNINLFTGRQEIPTHTTQHAARAASTQQGKEQGWHKEERDGGRREANEEERGEDRETCREQEAKGVWQADAYGEQDTGPFTRCVDESIFYYIIYYIIT